MCLLVTTLSSWWCVLQCFDLSCYDLWPFRVKEVMQVKRVNRYESLSNLSMSFQSKFYNYVSVNIQHIVHFIIFHIFHRENYNKYQKFVMKMKTVICDILVLNTFHLSFTNPEKDKKKVRLQLFLTGKTQIEDTLF
jgi:hypothetical protein